MIAVDGVELAVSDRGQGQPVICLHAIAHGGRDFEAFAALAGARYRIICVDWPGQGRSGDDVKELTPARYAELVRGIVVRLGIEDPIIIGCSIGGAAAVEYAGQFGAKAVVLANPGGLVEPSAKLRAVCLAFARFFGAGARGAWWFGPAFRLYYRLVLPSPAAAQQRKRIARAGYENAAVLFRAWSMFADPAKADQRRAALSLTMPVLFTWAMGDINRISMSAATIAGMKTARVEKFKGGHAAFLEQPQEFIAAFDRFVGELDSGVASARPQRSGGAALRA
jgi:4,5:9,10-diseco-3-hydroxy-5,9,17-trioxoandrosta-1(10),2-diene-4-oate hydrolase